MQHPTPAFEPAFFIQLLANRSCHCALRDHGQRLPEILPIGH